MSVDQKSTPSVFSAAYWREAAASFGNTRLLIMAALIVALRVAVKLVKIPLAGGLHLTLDCYVNSLGSLVYGPVMGLAVGAVSDTLGCMLVPTGEPYFLPFILVEMSSSFLFGLFFWKRPLSIPRILTAKFTVNLFCNIILTSACIKWEYYLGMYGAEGTYSFITLVRIVKNLVLFPVEAILIALVLQSASPALRSLSLLPSDHPIRKPDWPDILLVAVMFLLSVALVLLYIFFLKDFVSAHNFKWL